jgi:hypothetical protein
MKLGTENEIGTSAHPSSSSIKTLEHLAGRSRRKRAVDQDPQDLNTKYKRNGLDFED